MKDSLNELMNAWRGRNWQTIIFLIRQDLDGKITLVSAERNGGGKIEYQKLHRKLCTVLLSAFPQFYTLFWQYVCSLGCGYERIDYL